MNGENKCANLFNQDVDTNISVKQMLDMQLALQKNLAARGRAIDYSTADFKTRVDNLSSQWRNITTEFSELLERLPFKEWKTYSQEELSGFTSLEQKLETQYELIDIFHFFLNMCLAMEIDGETFVKLYATKNKENFDRQKRGY